MQLEAMMWFATMNVNKGGVYKGEIIRNLLENFPCAVIGLQEVNINPFIHVSFADEWRAFGFHCLLGAFDSDANVYRVAIISKLPLRQVTLPDVTCASRYAAGVVEVQQTSCVEKVLFGTIYGHANCVDSANDLVREVTSGMAQFTDKWILMGDYNLTACEGAVCELVSNGTVYNMDDPFCSSTLPATRGDKRRIDYGLCCKHLHPVAVDHTRGISDHVAVRYQFDFVEADLIGHIGPCHARKAVDPSLIPSLFAEAWDESAFNVALQTEQVDDAWHFLSCAAEKALFPDCGTVQPRSHAWTPRPQRKRSKAAAASESLPLVRLRRCVCDASSSLVFSLAMCICATRSRATFRVWCNIFLIWRNLTISLWRPRFLWQSRCLRTQRRVNGGIVCLSGRNPFLAA